MSWGAGRGVGFAVLIATTFLVLLAPLCLAQGAATAVGRARHDWHLTDYRLAYLTWNGGTGGIAWSPDAATSPTAPPGLAQEFVSEPLPDPLYLDGSRMIQFEMLLQGACNGQMATAPLHHVQLWAGTTYLGGVTNRDLLFAAASDQNYAAQYYQAPPGWCWRTYRIQPETDLLDRGAIVKLRYLRTSGEPGFALGLAEPARSLLRFPYLPPGEAAFRFPELYRDPNGEPTGATDGDGGSTAPVLVATALPLATLVPRRRRAMLIPVLLLAGAMAGCTGPAPGPSAEGTTGPSARADVRIEDDRENRTGLANGTTGGIAGSIRNLQERPIAAAYVGIGGNFFTETNRYGFFTFANVPVGVYELRADHKDYGSTTTPVTVEAGKVTRVDVFLGTVDTTDPNLRPHRHPKFPDDGKAVIFERALASNPPQGNPAGDPRGWNLIDLPEPYNIYPGTRRIEVRITWTSKAVTEVSLHFRSHLEGGLNTSALGPRGPGVPFNIATTWEMADQGHHTYSLWKDPWTFSQFKIIPKETVSSQPLVGRADIYTSTATADPVVFQVKITLFRGVIPIEPAHEDYWGGLNEYPVTVGKMATTDGARSFLAERIVPPETQWLSINLTSARAPQADWRQLLVKTGNLGSRVASVPKDDWAKAKLVTDRSDFKEWHLALKPGESDPFYAQKSGFEFYNPVDENSAGYLADSAASTAAGYGAGTKQRFTFHATAHRDAMPS